MKDYKHGNKLKMKMIFIIGIKYLLHGILIVKLKCLFHYIK